MSNVFARAAASVGRWTRLGGRRPADAAAAAGHDAALLPHHLALLEPVRIIEGESNAFEARAAAQDDMGALLAADAAIGLTLDAPHHARAAAAPAEHADTPWGDTSITAAALVDPADGEADAEAESRAVNEIAAVLDALTAGPEIPARAAIPMAEVPTAPEATGHTARDPQAVLERVQLVRPADEPRPAPAAQAKPDRAAKPAITFPQLYSLIAGEVNRRADDTAAVYERLLRSTRDELKATRRTTRLAWSVGGAMAAIAAVGACWAATEAHGTSAAVAGIRTQVAAGNTAAATAAAAERDRLRVELHQAKEGGRADAVALKARLDQALLVTADRDRLRGELATARQARDAAEGELKLARAVVAATTQPLSSARPAGAVRATLLGDDVTPAPADKPTADRWSSVLNGRE